MASFSYKINVNSPCQGDQLVSKVAPTHYVGANGDFTFAVLTRAPSVQPWTAIIYDYSSGGPCAPTSVFEQADPDEEEPAGEYELVGGTGELVVVPFP